MNLTSEPVANVPAAAGKRKSVTKTVTKEVVLPTKKKSAARKSTASVTEPMDQHRQLHHPSEHTGNDEVKIISY